MKKRKTQSLSLQNVAGFLRVAAEAVEEHKEEINALNTFPVPDGDTGTNIADTLFGVVSALASLPADASQLVVFETLKSSAVRHSRGNSGVILANMIWGAVEVLKDASELTVDLLAEAMVSSNERARAKTQRPIEGTMLTISRVIAETATEYRDIGGDSLIEMAGAILTAAKFAVDETPKMLAEHAREEAERTGEELKEYGDKPDSGAYAYGEVILSAIGKTITGKAFNFSLQKPKAKKASPAKVVNDNIHWRPGEPRYCTEFICHTTVSVSDEAALTEYLYGMGNSVQFSAADGFIKVHVHTDHFDKVLSHFKELGHISECHVNNMEEQTKEHLKKLAAANPPKPIAVVAVGASGFADLLLEAGATSIVDGGQSSNPETGAIIDAIDKTNAKAVFILPSNKNVIHSARLAAENVEDRKKCIVIDTLNVPQSLAALLACPFKGSLKKIEKSMTEAAMGVKVVSITRATRKYRTLKGAEGKKGDFIIIDDHEKVIDGCLAHSVAIAAAFNLLVEQGCEDGFNLYFGEDFGPSDEEAIDDLREKYPDHQINLIETFQPVYSVIIEGF